MLGGYVLEAYIAREGAKQKDSFSNENRYSSDDETVDEACAQESLNRDASVDVEVAGAAGSEFRNDFKRRPRHLFHHASAYRGEIERPAAQNHYPLFSVGPRWKEENGFESVAADHQCIYAFNKFVVAMGFAAVRREKVQSAIRARQEAVDGGPDKNRYGHREIPQLCGQSERSQAS
jgi:hypothetical protein